MVRKKHAWRLGIGLFAAVWVALVGLGIWTYRRPLPPLSVSQTAQAKSAAIPVSVPWPGQGQAAIGAKEYGVFASYGDQTPVPTASVAKLMTALAVLDKKPLAPSERGPMLTVTQHDIDIYNTYYAQDGSLAKVELGEQISQYDALQALLLPSANNFADMLANWAFGSVTDYCTYANDFAKKHGMPNTTISDASGFSPNTVSTANDLVQLGNLALEDPVVAEIVAKPTATIPVAGLIHNVNGLLGRDGINGLKTGNTDQAGGVFLVSAEHPLSNGQKVEVIAAVMKGADLVSAMRSTLPLLQTIKDNFNVTQAVKQNQEFGTVTTPWDNQKVAIVASKPVQFVSWSGSSTTTKVKLDPVQAGQPAGSTVGTAKVTLGQKTVEVPLVLKSATSSPDWRWRLVR